MKLKFTETRYLVSNVYSILPSIHISFKKLGQKRNENISRAPIQNFPS